MAGPCGRVPVGLSTGLDTWFIRRVRPAAVWRSQDAGPASTQNQSHASKGTGSHVSAEYASACHQASMDTVQAASLKSRAGRQMACMRDLHITDTQKQAQGHGYNATVSAGEMPFTTGDVLASECVEARSPGLSAIDRDRVLAGAQRRPAQQPDGRCRQPGAGAAVCAGAALQALPCGRQRPRKSGTASA